MDGPVLLRAGECREDSGGEHGDGRHGVPGADDLLPLPVPLPVPAPVIVAVAVEALALLLRALLLGFVLYAALALRRPPGDLLAPPLDQTYAA